MRVHGDAEEDGPASRPVRGDRSRTSCQDLVVHHAVTRTWRGSYFPETQRADRGRRNVSRCGADVRSTFHAAAAADGTRAGPQLRWNMGWSRHCDAHSCGCSYRVPPMPGGLERHVECLTREQVGLGHRITMVFRHGTAVPTGATQLSPAPSRPVTGARPRCPTGPRSRRRPPRRSGHLCLSTHSHDVDVLHLHGDHVEATWLGPAVPTLSSASRCS